MTSTDDDSTAESAAPRTTMVVAMPEIMTFEKKFLHDKILCKKFLNKLDSTVKQYVDPGIHARIINKSIFFPVGEDGSLLANFSAKTEPEDFIKFLKDHHSLETNLRASHADIQQAVASVCRVMHEENYWRQKTWSEFYGAVVVCIDDAERHPDLKGVLDKEKLFSAAKERILEKRILSAMIAAMPGVIRNWWDNSLLGDEHQTEHETLEHFRKTLNSKEVAAIFQTWKVTTERSGSKSNGKGGSSGKAEKLFCTACEKLTNHSADKCFKLHPELKTKSKKEKSVQVKDSEDSASVKAESAPVQQKESNQEKARGKTESSEKTGKSSRVCYVCGDPGHLRRDCKQKVVGRLDVVPEIEESKEERDRHEQDGRFFTAMQLVDKDGNFSTLERVVADGGAEADIAPEFKIKRYEQLGFVFGRTKAQKLVDLNGHTIQCEERVTLKVRMEGKRHLGEPIDFITVNVWISPKHSDFLLGAPTLKRMGFAASLMCVKVVKCVTLPIDVCRMILCVHSIL